MDVDIQKAKRALSNNPNVESALCCLKALERSGQDQYQVFQFLKKTFRNTNKTFFGHPRITVSCFSISFMSPEYGFYDTAPFFLRRRDHENFEPQICIQKLSYSSKHTFLEYSSESEMFEFKIKGPGPFFINEWEDIDFWLKVQRHNLKKYRDIFQNDMALFYLKELKARYLNFQKFSKIVLDRTLKWIKS